MNALAPKSDPKAQSHADNTSRTGDDPTSRTGDNPHADDAAYTAPESETAAQMKSRSPEEHAPSADSLHTPDSQQALKTLHPRSIGLLSAMMIATGVYITTYALNTPLFFYLPVERTFAWTAPPNAITMGFFGLLANGVLAFLTTYACATVPALHTRLTHPRIARTVTTLAPWWMAATLLFFVVSELIVNAP